MDLYDKVALITGGRRIGAGVAATLAERGVDVALSYARSRAEAEQAAGAVRAVGRRAEAVQADLVQADACNALVETVATQFGRVDILINMASVYTPKAFD